MDEILVSINCITYNHEKYIADAIESFLMQKTNFKFEILIHDDASTDKTSDIVRNYAREYPNIIKPIIEKENQYSKGVGVFCLNLRRARGKYIAICEGDDYWTDPYKLQKQVNYMKNNPECSMCFHATEIIRVGKGKVNEIKPYNKNCISPTEDIILGGGEFIATNSILYRKEVMDKPPKFYLNAPVGDYPLQILSSIENYAYYINEFMSVYRIGVEGSWSSRMSSQKNKEKEAINLFKRLIVMLNEFNEYSNGIYSNSINRKILENEFEILKIERKIKQLKMPKYKIVYDSLGMNRKIKIYANCYFYKTYNKLSNIKRYINEKL